MELVIHIDRRMVYRNLVFRPKALCNTLVKWPVLHFIGPSKVCTEPFDHTTIGIAIKNVTVYIKLSYHHGYP